MKIIQQTSLPRMDQDRPCASPRITSLSRIGRLTEGGFDDLLSSLVLRL